MNFGVYMTWDNDNRYHFDNNGIPQAILNGKNYYNPTTVAQYALMRYGKYIYGQVSLEDFVLVANKLMSLQDQDGAFPYPFDLKLYYRDIVFPAGWISCLAQGQALSVFSRA